MSRCLFLPYVAPDKFGDSGTEFWGQTPAIRCLSPEFCPTVPEFAPVVLLLRYSVMFVIHADVVLPLFRNIVLRKDGRHRTRRLASPAVNAFFGMNVEHRGGLELRLVLLWVDAVHRTCVHARRILGADAGFANDVCHRISLWDVNAVMENKAKIIHSD